jgi:hypothetical protein
MADGSRDRRDQRLASNRIRGLALQTLMKLLRRRHVLHAEMKRPERAPDELERDRDLLERVAAGVALNKTPGR